MPDLPSLASCSTFSGNDHILPGGVGGRTCSLRRELLGYSATFGSAFLAAQGLLAEEPKEETPAAKKAAPPAGKRYDMKKSINLWALPYPQKMTLKECFQLCKDAGFDGVEVNYALEGDLSPQASEAAISEIGQMARKIGIQISGVCSFLFWPYAFTHQDPERRKKGVELAGKMIQAARLLETENLLVVPGASMPRGFPTSRQCRTTWPWSERPPRSSRSCRWPRSTASI